MPATDRSVTGPAWLERLVALSAVPADAEAARAFMQRRLGRYYGLLALLYGGTFVASRVNAALFIPEWRAWWTHPAPWLHLGLGVATGLSWIMLRRKPWSARTLDRADMANTIEQAILLSLIVVATGDGGRTAVEMVLGMAHILAARAAIVPSSPRRTAIIGAVAHVPFIAATAWVLQDAAPVTAVLGRNAMLFGLTVWCLVGVVTSTAIGIVIYGLERQVRAAQRLGQYTLESRIGEGGMGVVYRAKHAMLRRPTAVKLLRPELSDARSLARFEREVQRTAELTSPNTIAVFDYGRTPDGLFYYAMEYLDGFDLQTLVRLDGPLAPGRVVHLMAQAAGALAEAHHAGLIHRDVKPSNLVVTHRGITPDFLKVLDFGLVRDTRATDPTLSQVDTIQGTPLFMSPEQAVDPEHVDPRSDLYAFGAVTYFLLTGTPPFDGRNTIEVVSKHLNDPPLPPSERVDAVPGSLERLVLRCLEKRPDDRPSSAVEVLDALRELQDVTPWTAADAERWWETQVARLRERLAAEATPMSSGSQPTLFVDVEGRRSRRPTLSLE